MTHSDWTLQRERLSAYIDGELSADDRAELEAHAPDCAQCRGELAALRQTRALLAALPAPSLPRSFTLPVAPLRIDGGRRAPAWSRPAQALGGIAAAVGLGILVTTSLPHIGASYGAAGAATSAAAPTQHMPAGAATLAPSGASPTAQYGSVTAPPTSTADASGTGAPPTPTVAPARTEFPTLPVSGGVLLIGGVAAVGAGSLARRRARRYDAELAS